MSDPVRTVSIRYDRGALSIIGSAYLGTTADNAVDRIQLSNTPAGATATLVYGISIRSDGRLVVPEQELGDDESVLVNADVMRACTSGALPVRLRLDWTETGADGNPVTRRVMTEPVTLEVRPASPGSDTSRPETLTAAMTRISSWAWVETLTYKAGSIVAHGGRAWTSLQASNRGHEPVLGSEWWATFDADEETLAGLRDAISAEAADRQSADGKLREDLDAEISARTAAVSDEASLRDAGDAALSARITAEQAERSAADTDEANTRASADDALRASISDNASAISAETSARESAVSAEASARAKAVSDEAAARASADTALQTAVDGKAPISHASAGTEYGVGSATQYGHVRVDTALSSTSTNPVQNKVVQSALAAKQGTLTWDTAPTAGSANPVTSGGVKTAIDAEASARASAVSSEASARANADSAETSARESADTAEAGTRASEDAAIRSDLSAEVSARKAADTALGKRIDALGSASGKDVGTASGQVPILGSGGKLDNSVIPAIALSEYLGVVASAGALTGLTGQKGDYAVVSGTSATSGTYIISDNDGSSASDWVRISGPTDITPGDGIVVSGSVVGLASSGVTAGSKGSAVQIPTVTVDQYGRVTALGGTAVYPPTTAGTSGQVWRSDGSGAGVWETPDTAPTASSSKLVTSGAVKTAVDAEAQARAGAVSDEASARQAADAALQTAVDGKQDPIVAGSDISIGDDGCTISATDMRPTAGTGVAVSGTKVSLASSGVTAGTYGSNVAVPRLVIDAHGRVTGASTQAIYPPTTAGTAGQLWQSDGSGQGVWQTLDTAPTADSVKAVTSGGVKAAIDAEATARASADSALQGTVDGKAAKTEALGTSTALGISTSTGARTLTLARKTVSGVWSSSAVTIPEATHSASGLMTAAHVSELDSVKTALDAKAAKTEALGTGTVLWLASGTGARNLTLTRKTVSGVSSASVVSLPAATSTASGLMTPAHVSKLAGLADPLSMADIVDKIYPVGSIYTSTSSTNPSTLFGGAWAAFGAGRVLMGAGDSSYPAGSTGGEAAHQLTEREMPSHRHYIDNPVRKIAGVYNPQDHHVADSANVGYGYDEGQGTRWNGTDRYYWYTWQESGQTNDIGGSMAHNNLPPYIVVYMWKRTA